MYNYAINQQLIVENINVMNKTLQNNASLHSVKRCYKYPRMILLKQKEHTSRILKPYFLFKIHS